MQTNARMGLAKCGVLFDVAFIIKRVIRRLLQQVAFS